MGLDDLTRDLVSLADTLSKDLQCTVQQHGYTGKDKYGAPTYGAVVPRKGFLEEKPRLVRDLKGQEVMASAKFSALLPFAVNPLDKFVVPDGRTMYVMSFGGFIDPETGRAFVPEVFLG